MSYRKNFIDSLLIEMTIEEKVGQMTLFTSGWEITGPVLRESYRQDIIEGKCGNLFNAHTVEYVRELQRLAVEETRMGIPLLFGYDVIHGYKTIFPIPIAEACSWDLEMIEKSARLASKEAAAAGLNWTFNPMVDIGRDPRWGRIAEGGGEDPFLGSLIARAKVRGTQGDNLADPLTLAACVKHFAAYGAPEGGRDYGTVDMSERVFRQTYALPYVAAVEEGAATVMTSFNELFGIPATASHFLLTEFLRDELDFKGMVVTDYTAINELVNHGVASDDRGAAKLAIEAGVDMDMQGTVFYNHLLALFNDGEVEEKLINQAVQRILELKYDLGLFDDPYRYLDDQREKEIVLSDEMLKHAHEAALRSIVLLENKSKDNSKLLPVRRGNYNSIAVIGPLANNKIDVLGSWHAAGNEENTVSVVEGLTKKFPELNIRSAQGSDISSDDRSDFNSALQLARNSDLVILAVGEDYNQSGEAASRSDISLPGVQEELCNEILATGKDVIVVIFAGRPLIIDEISKRARAVIYAWQPGSRTGDALADIIFGDYNPSARLVMTFPYNVGQIPVYYGMKNTGRPFNPDQKYTSKYLDVPNEGLYPFGYGLSYTEFNYSPIVLNNPEIGFSDELEARVTVKNTGSFAGEEVVQLYIRDLVSSITRPLKELKGFQKVFLEPGESKDITFIISSEDLSFYDIDMKFKAEEGKFRIYIGGNSKDVKEAEFSLVE